MSVKYGRSFPTSLRKQSVYIHIYSNQELFCWWLCVFPISMHQPCNRTGDLSCVYSSSHPVSAAHSTAQAVYLKGLLGCGFCMIGWVIKIELVWNSTKILTLNSMSLLLWKLVRNTTRLPSSNDVLCIHYISFKAVGPNVNEYLGKEPHLRHDKV